MAVYSLRFAGDPVLTKCSEGTHRMLLNEQNLSVVRVQAALNELGYFIGAAGADGFFGPDTGAAVSAFKTDQGLSPTDPVVGKGTITALDNLFFVAPPALDPAFAEFSPFVAVRRLEPFVAMELSQLIAAPLNSWRHMAGMHALNALSNNSLCGIVAQTRFDDLVPHILGLADPIQPTGETIQAWLQAQHDFYIASDGSPQPNRGSASTFSFRSVFGQDIAIIVISDAVFRGKEVTILAATGQTIKVDLIETVVHELVHMRNLGSGALIMMTPDFDPASYTDISLADLLTRTMPAPTASVLARFIDEVSARHVEWHLRQERQGSEGNIVALTPEMFAAAVIQYMARFPRLFDAGNDYVTTINARFSHVTERLSQAALWLRRLDETTVFSDIANDEQAVHDRLRAAADFCEQQVLAGATSDPSNPSGLFPLVHDFP